MRAHDDIRYSPDVLDIIFALLDMKSLQNAARVCRVWYEIAADHIWRDLHGLDNLITQFWPPWIHDKNGTEISDEKDQNLWLRFHDYSRRVRRLETGLGEPSLSAVMYLKHLEEKYRSETDFQPPIPLLQEIVWDPDVVENIGALQFFITPSLRKLRISPNGCERPRSNFLTTLLLSLSQQSLHLSSLSIDTDWEGEEDKEVGEALATFVESQQTLEQALFPQFYVQHSIIGALARLDRLQTFHGLLDYYTAQEVDTFIADLAAGCPALRHLVLYAANDSTPEHKIRFQTIVPLLSCKSLVELQILHGKPLRLNSRDIQEMGRAWPDIATLSLCPTLTSESSKGLQLEELASFGCDSFPKLERLAVFLNLSSRIPNACATLPRLNCRVLCVGTSRITSDTDLDLLSQYLSTVCLPGVQLSNIDHAYYRAFVFGTDEDPGLTDEWKLVAEKMEKWT
ncbi:hypothetical protein FRB90_011919 [Tulasnella sp. 427]|nr:hypothetical protein FRB90_011919 [Tulasnella sp. 427]